MARRSTHGNEPEPMHMLCLEVWSFEGCSGKSESLPQDMTPATTCLPCVVCFVGRTVTFLSDITQDAEFYFMDPDDNFTAQVGCRRSLAWPRSLKERQALKPALHGMRCLVPVPCHHLLLHLNQSRLPASPV